MLVQPLAAQSLPNVGAGLPNLGGTEREELSPAMERRLGEQIMRDLRQDPDYLDDAPTLEYLNNFGNTLVSARPEVRGDASFDFFFFAVRDGSLNAFALPGGFIGVHSGLLLAAQNESELASVLAHEIGHVAQRHIARMLGAQRQDMLVPLASLLLGALAARSSPDVAMASVMGGQGLAIQRQLNFSRDAEREADRVGLQILDAGAYDTSGMVAFFGRLQTATRNYGEGIPAYLQSHPLTTERIADIQARIRQQRYHQHADNIDFYLIRARVRVLQNDNPQGWRDAAKIFETELAPKTRVQTAAAKYGLALIALRQGDAARAQSLLDEARAAALKDAEPLASLGVEIRLAANQTDAALKQSAAAREAFPLSRDIASQYADALIAAGKIDEAVRYLRDQSQLYREDARVQQRLAKAYATQGKQALQHLALAESYAIKGSLPAALDQLQIARRAPDASFYDQSIIDARERELKAQRLEEMKQNKEGKNKP
nr:M48 family metalloprotease [Noviherbaspirillum pedocola]